METKFPERARPHKYKRSAIGLRISTKEMIDRCRDPGQCYDGFIQQMVEYWEKSKGYSH